jgi:hypothetical protein
MIFWIDSGQPELTHQARYPVMNLVGFNKLVF